MGSSPTVRTSNLAATAGLGELVGEAAGLAHPLYALSPGGAVATAERVAALRPLIDEAVAGTDVDPDVLARAQAESWSFGDALRGIIFPELGEGLVPIPEIVADLQKRGYDGWYVLEQDTTHKHPRDAAAINLRYIQGLTA